MHILHKLQAAISGFTETARSHSGLPHETEHTPMLVEEMEPRILHSADLSPAVLAGDALDSQAEHRMLEQQASPATPAPTQATEQTTTLELVFVDPTTPDYQTLLDDISLRSGNHSFEVILLDSDGDGVKQISETLAARDTSAQSTSFRTAAMARSTLDKRSSTPASWPRKARNSPTGAQR